MKIREIRCAGLRGATPEGGWSNELRPEDCVHTLISVYTDENGNFYKLASAFTIPSGAQAGVRNANGKKVMPSNKTPGPGCEKSGCHTGASGENPRIWISP